MKCLIVLACVAAVSLGELLPEHHVVAQDMCSALPDLSFLKGDQATPEAKAKLLPHLVKVCEIYKKHYAGGALGPITKRNIIDGLLGQNSKLSALLKAASALNQAKGVFDEVKNLAPTVHDHLKGSIKDVQDGLQDVLDSIYNEFSKGSTTTATY